MVLHVYLTYTIANYVLLQQIGDTEVFKYLLHGYCRSVTLGHLRFRLI